MFQVTKDVYVNWKKKRKGIETKTKDRIIIIKDMFFLKIVKYIILFIKIKKLEER